MTVTLSILIFLCGIAGFIVNRKNVIILIVAIEILLLAVEKLSPVKLYYAAVTKGNCCYSIKKLT